MSSVVIIFEGEGFTKLPTSCKILVFLEGFFSLELGEKFSCFQYIRLNYFIAQVGVRSLPTVIDDDE